VFKLGLVVHIVPPLVAAVGSSFAVRPRRFFGKSASPEERFTVTWPSTTEGALAGARAEYVERADIKNVTLARAMNAFGSNPSIRDASYLNADQYKQST